DEDCLRSAHVPLTVEVVNAEPERINRLLLQQFRLFPHRTTSTAGFRSASPLPCSFGSRPVTFLEQSFLDHRLVRYPRVVEEFGNSCVSSMPMLDGLLTENDVVPFS